MASLEPPVYPAVKPWRLVNLRVRGKPQVPLKIPEFQMPGTRVATGHPLESSEYAIKKSAIKIKNR